MYFIFIYQLSSQVSDPKLTRTLSVIEFPLTRYSGQSNSRRIKPQLQNALKYRPDFSTGQIANFIEAYSYRYESGINYDLTSLLMAKSAIV